MLDNIVERVAMAICRGRNYAGRCACSRSPQPYPVCDDWKRAARAGIAEMLESVLAEMKKEALTDERGE